jgi:hydrogenase expression/formation protein HypE
MSREENANNKVSGFDGYACPMPLRDYPNVVLGHGGGGKLSGDLIEHLFLPAFKNDYLVDLGDSAVFNIGSQRLAFATDSFVVRPLFFPGGSIGDLAINGTVNDLAMSGASPRFLSAGFIVEEGFPMGSLAEIVHRMAEAANRAGVHIVAGDTKVVDKGHGDGCYINTSGIGIVPDGLRIAPDQAEPGDAIILSGTMGDHGMAIMSVREGLEFEAEIESDSAALHTLVEKIIEVCPKIHTLRDPTRGGVASSLNEIACASNVGMVLEESSIPVAPPVQSACEILGMDPMFVANEGKLIAIVPSDQANSVLAEMHRHKHGRQASIIGYVSQEHPKMVVARTAIGTTRVVTMQIGEQLPRIC